LAGAGGRELEPFRDAWAPSRRLDLFITTFRPGVDDAHEWIGDYERATTNLGWSERRIKKHLFDFVGEEAKNWIRTLELRPLHSENRDSTPRARLAWDKLDWYGVKALFVDHFSTDYSMREEWERMFRELQAWDHFAYVEHKERAGRELGKTEEEIIRAICIHLLPEYAQAIGAVRCYSIGDVLAALKFVQEQMGQQARDRAEEAAGGDARRAIQRLEREVAELSSQLQGARNPAGRSEPGRRRECFQCGEITHLARDCRARQPVRERYQARYRDRAAGMGSGPGGLPEAAPAPQRAQANPWPRPAGRGGYPRH